MITDEQAYEAADWIHQNCGKIADAKANRVYIEERLRVVRAEIILATEGTVSTKEAAAFASPEYAKELEDYKQAIREESFLLTKLKAAETKMEYWRTQSATLRHLK